MSPRKTLSQALRDEMNEEKENISQLKKESCILVLIALVLFTFFCLALWSGLKKQMVVNCYKWARYEEQYSGFSLDKTARDQCSELGVEIARNSVEIDTSIPETLYTIVTLPEGQKGTASWYDYPFAGEPEYSRLNSTCASRDYPRGSYLLVTREGSGESVICRVNDYIEHPDRIIDLSSYAFMQIAPLSLGLVEVSVVEIETGTYPLDLKQ